MSAPLLVLDTDVVVTALIGSENAASNRLCRAVGTGEIRLATSDRFLEELTRIVRQKHAEGLIWNAARAFELALDIGFHAEHHSFEPRSWPSVPDALDWWILDLAYEAEADLAVAWDRHLLDATLPIPLEIIIPPEAVFRLGL